MQIKDNSAAPVMIDKRVTGMGRRIKVGGQNLTKGFGMTQNTTD